MQPVFPGYFIQCPVTSLGKNNGISRTNSGQILSIWLPPGADDVSIGFKQRVK
jgi:hypothetical protein